MSNFSRLRLQGFKSFVEKSDLDIGPGLTGIVGPNGCGKSNLVEALSWVMGETSAKRLRGSGMDDVIFNGTSNRPARNSAEVSVVLDNRERTAPALFNATDEIEVVRRIERDMGSSYYVNSKPVRARDVQMLFADMAIGAHSTAIVSQGRIAAIINAKPAERRQVLEESAGVSGLYVRRHEAELRLKAADANLARLQDVVAGLETQLDSLKRQSRQATRYKNISAEIKALETKLALAEWMIARTLKSEAEQEYNDSEGLVAERMGRVAELNRLQIEQGESLPPLREKQAETAAAWQAQNFELRRLDDEEQRITAQIDEAKSSLSHISNDRTHEEQSSSESTSMLEKLDTEEKELLAQSNTKEEITRLTNDRGEKELDVLRLQENYQSTLEKAASLKATRATLESQLSQDQNRLSSVKARIASLQQQIEQKRAQQEAATPVDGLNTEIDTLDLGLAEKRSAEQTSKEALDTAQHALDEARATQQTSREALSKIQSEMNALESVLKSESQSGFRPVLDEIKADDGFEAALSKALGDTIMASTASDAPAVWSGKSTVDQSPEFPAGVAPLRPHIKAPEALQTALSYIGYVEDDTKGEEACSQLKAGQSIVSKDGAYWRWDGLCIRAKAMDRNAIRLKNKNRLEELQSQLPNAQSAFNSAEDKLRATQADVQSCRQTVQNLEQDVRNIDRSLANKRTELQRAIEKRAHTESEIAKLEEGLNITGEDIERLEAAVFTHQTSMQSFDDESLARQNLEVEQRKLALAAAQGALSEASAALEVFQQGIRRREARLRAIADERVSLNNRAIRAKDRLKNLDEREEILKTKLEEVLSRPDEITAQRLALLDTLKTMENAKNASSDALALAEKELAETSRSLKESEALLMEVRESRAKAQATMEAASGSIEIIRQSIEDQFSMNPDELWQSSEMDLEKLNSEPIDKLRGKRDRLIRERDGMGPVNLRADVESQEVEQQLAKLCQERSDLAQAIEELRGGIHKLNKEARERLQQAFNTVNGHFQTLFTRLFGGGSAHLAFVDSDDPLEASLEIFASPPGKSLQSLSLLSGGEKTLASTALIFAMFLTNPAPICVLDEIDAPLDDANVDRVCTMLEEIVQQCSTRFVIITHHRLTMARMDRLYGVTMSERGVSQLVSVDLQGKLDFLEAAE
ncbi:MAG TPA: chromosome segregation protein SMC [Alphaproteobacteria bacterium]|nr:chromosome segregation protein SMC [Alphaproteobacteria bacterium]